MFQFEFSFIEIYWLVWSISIASQNSFIVTW